MMCPSKSIHKDTTSLFIYLSNCMKKETTGNNVGLGLVIMEFSSR